MKCTEPEEMEKQHRAIRVYGTVQGVFFRQSTQEKAQELGLTGFVRNEPDGSVYLEAEGEAEALQQLEKWCHQGPRMALVSKVEAQAGEVKNYAGFEVWR